MKNLANCKPSEFLKQTNKIRKSVEKWLTVTDLENIRKRQPVLSADMSDEEQKKAYTEQAKENISAILDSVLDKHPDETLEVLALMCFVEPKNVDKHTVSEYLGAFNEIVNDKNVIDFLSSLLRLGQSAGLGQ